MSMYYGISIKKKNEAKKLDRPTVRNILQHARASDSEQLWLLFSHLTFNS